MHGASSRLLKHCTTRSNIHVRYGRCSRCSSVRLFGSYTTNTISPLPTTRSTLSSSSYSTWRPKQQKLSPGSRPSRRHSAITFTPSVSYDGQTQQEQILERAKAYGVRDANDLALDQRFVLGGASTRRLTALDGALENIDFWSILLDYQQLNNGDDGVRNIWLLLIHRCRRMPLPVEGPQADQLWSAFISFGIRNRKFLKPISAYEETLEVRRPHFFVEVVGGILASEDPSDAHLHAYRLQARHPVTTNIFLQILAKACSSKSTWALAELCTIIRKLALTHVYGEVVPYLCSQHRYADAFTMHNFLLGRKDYPLAFNAIAPLVKHIATSDLDLQVFLQSFRRYNLSYDAQVRDLFDREQNPYLGLAGDSLDAVRNQTFGVRPKTLSDSFIARLFATSSLGFKLVLNGLHLFGVRAIGALAVREMAIRAGDPATLWEYFEQLSALEIDTGGSTYVRLVKKLVTDSKGANGVLLSAILSSDQHPDVFEDQDLQYKLLRNYYHVQDWQEVNRTLAIMTLDHGHLVRHSGNERTHKQSEAAANVMLYSALTTASWVETTNVLLRMSREGFAVSKTNIGHMYNMILVERRASSRPQANSSFDDLSFLIRCWQLALRSGSRFSASCWREPIRRLGLLGRWNDAERLVCWLAAWYKHAEPVGNSSYNPAGPSLTVSARRPVGSNSASADSVSQLDFVFSPSLQRALVEWGFMAAGPAESPSSARTMTNVGDVRFQNNPHHWARGLKLLRQLQSLFGIELDATAVRKAVTTRLRNLFSVGGVSRRPLNRIARSNNSFQLSYYMKMIDEIWGEPLFPEVRPAIFLALHKSRPRDVSRIRVQENAKRRRHTGHRTVPSRAAIPRHGTRVDEKAEPNFATLQDRDSDMEGVVMYRDIFNASWEDYQKRDANSREGE